MQTFTESTDSSTDAPSAFGQRGIAAGMLITLAGSGKQKAVEKMSGRYCVTSFDFDRGRRTGYKIKQRIEHIGQKILCLGFKPDWRQGTKDENFISALFLSEWQEVWAADGRDFPARWIKARDLVPGRHVLKLALVNEKGPWAELVMAGLPEQEKNQNFPVYELVLVESDSYSVNDVLCRTASVLPVKKRVVYPLKDFPLINFVPQPETLRVAHAEVWYRKSAALLPRCIGESLEPMARVHAMLELKRRMREVAAKSLIETNLRGEFIERHSLPVPEELIPDHEQLTPETLKRTAEAAIQMLSAPGVRHYSEFAGGMEIHYVSYAEKVTTGAGIGGNFWRFSGKWELVSSVDTGYDHYYWKFDGNQWVQTTAEDCPPPGFHSHC